MNRKELLNKIASTLGDATNAQDDTRQIVMHVLNLSHADLLAHGDIVVNRSHVSRSLKLAKARSRNVPMAQLLGSREFFGREFTVNKHVLIPRPETEVMVEEAIKLSNDDSMFIDIGAGSGAIAITLNLETSLLVIGTDISKRALKIAHKNASKLNTKIELHLGSLLNPIWPNELGRCARVIITANLPYLSTNMWNTSPCEVKDHEPKIALVSDNTDGLDLYRELLDQIADRRSEFPTEVFALLEIDPRQIDLIDKLVSTHAPNASFHIKNDLAGKPRVVIITL